MTEICVSSRSKVLGNCGEEDIGDWGGGRGGSVPESEMFKKIWNLECVRACLLCGEIFGSSRDSRDSPRDLHERAHRLW